MLFETLEAQAARHDSPCGAGRMVWRVWNAAGGAPLLLLHGGSGSWRHWVKQIALFAPRRCVIAPDLPGLGDSDDPPEPATPDSVAALVVQGLRGIVADTAAVDLAGFSFGAMIAGHVAQQLAPALRSLTLVGAGGLGTPRSAVPLEKVRDKQGAARAAAHRFNLESLMIADPALVDDEAMAIQALNSDGARLRSRQFAPSATLRDALVAARSVPVNAIWGERDASAMLDVGIRVRALQAARPDARAVHIPGAGHWAQYEAAAQVDALLLDWLREDR